MNIKAMSQDNIWKNPISCNVTNKKNDHIYIFIYIYTGMDPAAYFWGGARRNFTELPTHRVAFLSVALHFDVT